MAETLGSLIDKLTICNVRIWHLIEKQRDRSLPDSERLSAADAADRVNGQRSKLIDEIDRFVADTVTGKVKILTDPKEKM
jgi:hypothetical protein